jgi:DNA-binding transcriptional MerR regulator
MTLKDLPPTGFTTRKEAAEILRCSTRTLQRLERAKQLPPVHLTQRIIGYRNSDLLRYLHERTAVA